MCTVTFVATSTQVIITHNRDEKTIRPAAIEPRNYSINNKNILFPKDEKAGGTWFAIAENGTILVLLNGADEKHLMQPNYRKSRGLIVLDLISSSSVISAWKTIDLSNIEPFTIVLFEDTILQQLRWNGTEKSDTILDNQKPHIWSSSTLYPTEIRNKREQWFLDFLKNNLDINPVKMIDFHKNTENENSENGLIINRNNQMKTLSITQSVVENNKLKTKYFDLITKQEFSSDFISI